VTFEDFFSRSLLCLIGYHDYFYCYKYDDGDTLPKNTRTRICKRCRKIQWRHIHIEPYLDQRFKWNNGEPPKAFVALHAEEGDQAVIGGYGKEYYDGMFMDKQLVSDLKELAKRKGNIIVKTEIKEEKLIKGFTPEELGTL